MKNCNSNSNSNYSNSMYLNQNGKLLDLLKAKRKHIEKDSLYEIW